MNNEKKTPSDRADSLANRIYLNQARWNQSRRRAPRAEVEPALHALRILLNDGSTNVFPIRTISEVGAFCVHPSPQVLALRQDQRVSLSLLIENSCYNFDGAIRYVGRDGFAIEFMQPPEPAQERIRNMLGPEFLAATLTPHFTNISTEPGSTRTLIYSDGVSNFLHVSLADQKLLAVELELEILGLRILWRKTAGKNVGEFVEGGHRSVVEKMKLLSFVRNLTGLTGDYFKEIESILTRV